MGETVQFNGTVEKVGTFSSKGGGLELKVQTPHDRSVGGILLDNTQRPARIMIEYSDEPPVDPKDTDDSKQGRLPMDTNEATGETGIRPEYTDADGEGMEGEDPEDGDRET